MTDPLRDIAARPRRYENVDGTTEMSFGLMIFAMTLMGYLIPIAEKNAILPRGLAGYLLILAGTLVPFILLGTVLTRTIKKHITYPRTGYVAYRRMTGENRWRTGFFAIALSVAAAILASLVPLIQRNHDSSIVRALMIFGFLGPYAFFALNTSKEHPWKRYVIFAMAIGLLTIAFLVPGDTEQLSRPVMVFSVSAWLVSGAATLVVCIRNTHAPDVGDE
jgi:MFS family permease